MVARMVVIVVVVLISIIVWWGWKLLNWAWLKPKKLEKWLREEGYKGNSYKTPLGDIITLSTMMKEAQSKSLPLTHDITPHVVPFDHHIVNKYGKRSFMWFGPTPKLNMMDLELIKEIFLRPNEFLKPHPEPVRDNIVGGLVVLEGEKWSKHRQIINPTFYLENIKSMFPNICRSCNDIIDKWELLTVGSGKVEVDVWPYIEHLVEDVISRTAFGSCYEEGQTIFRVQKEQQDLVLQRLLEIHLPGGRFLPTKANRKFKENNNQLEATLRGIIDKRKKSIDMGESMCDDLLGVLLKSNSKEIKEYGVEMSMEDVIEECKLFYIAGSETTTNLIAWTMVCLSFHPEWQFQAREEILRVFGTGELHFEGVKNLKILTMILNEVLRLYPPVTMIARATTKETKLGHMTIPSGVIINIPIMLLHHDRDIWGEDATEFKPERFSEGVAGATKGSGSSSFLPFTGGPRVCIGQNFALTEAKAAMSKILQRFSFELSPSYKHSPFSLFTLPPTAGVHLILHNV